LIPAEDEIGPELFSVVFFCAAFVVEGWDADDVRKEEVDGVAGR
jgi:hypothetical protein